MAEVLITCTLGFPTRERRVGEMLLPCGCVIEPELPDALVAHALRDLGISREQLERSWPREVRDASP